MIVTKKIFDESNKDIEFEINITDDISNVDNNTSYIVVNNEDELSKAYEAINNVNKYPGLITISISELYNIFNKSNTWNYKYIEGTKIDEIKRQLDNLKRNKIFLSFECNENYSLFDYEDIINYCINNNSDSKVYFGLPFINNTNKIILHVLYK